MYGALYTKLGINAAMNGLSAISGLTLGELVQSPQNRHFWMVIATELIAIAKGIELLQIGTLHPQDVAITGKDSPTDLEKKHQLLKTIFGRYMSVKPSTLQSLERNRPSEINYLNGYIVKKGKELGVSTPINSKITEMVREIEAGKRKITKENLEKI
jgi:2-dehydropantoate 2-reductase